MKPKNAICLCRYCIDAIRSRGEKVWELEENTDEDITTCELCEEDNDVLYICIFP